MADNKCGFRKLGLFIVFLIFGTMVFVKLFQESLIRGFWKVAFLIQNVQNPNRFLFREMRVNTKMFAWKRFKRKKKKKIEGNLKNHWCNLCN